jgi:hypothetical protein
MALRASTENSKSPLAEPSCSARSNNNQRGQTTASSAGCNNPKIRRASSGRVAGSTGGSPFAHASRARMASVRASPSLHRLRVGIRKLPSERRRKSSSTAASCEGTPGNWSQVSRDVGNASTFEFSATMTSPRGGLGLPTSLFIWSSLRSVNRLHTSSVPDPGNSARRRVTLSP